MQAVININHYHGTNQETPTKIKEKHTYSLLTNPNKEACDSTGATASEDHDYDEPYLEPACTEKTLLMQLKSLSVPLLAKESLRLVSSTSSSVGRWWLMCSEIVHCKKLGVVVTPKMGVKTVQKVDVTP